MGSENTDTGEQSSNERGVARRSFLGSLGALGATGAMGTAGAKTGEGLPVADHVDQWANLDDPYYSKLVSDLKGMGLPPGEFVYAQNEADTLAAYELSGSAGTSSSIDPGGDVPFNEAKRIEVTGDVTNPWDVTFNGTVEGRPVEQGDVLLGVAYLRSPSAGDQSSAEVRYVAKDEDNISTNMVRNANQPRLDTEWSRYYFQIKFDYSAEAGTWWTEFFMGFGQQTVDVGGVALIGFDDDVAVSDLPTWQPSYEWQGRAEDAQWRKEAKSRIQNIRKADLEVSVVDPDGNGVEGASVEVAMQDHEFAFGTAIAVNQLPGGNGTYKEKLLETFNKAVPENGLKVPAWSGEWGASLGPQSTRAAIQWLLDHDVPTRGHALVWEEYDWMNIDSGLSTKRINELVKKRIRTRASAFQGDLPEWDMHNHPIWQSNIRQDVGRDKVPEWWATAHDAAPDAEMYVNEMNIVAGSSYRDAYDEFITFLMDNDAGVDGIGFMGHFGINSLTPPGEILSVYDRFAEHGVPLLVTEFDVQLDSRDDDAQVQAQADYVRDFLTASFSHEAVEGVMSWGFWANEHWRPTAAYWSSDWTLRPHGEEFRRLVFEEWWTDESGQTDAEGTFSVNGFKGEYEVTASSGDLSGTATATLSDGGTTVEVQLTESTPTPTATETASTDGDTPTATETDATGGDTPTETASMDGDTPTATETDATGGDTPTETDATGGDTPADSGSEATDTETTSSGGQPGLGVATGVAGLAGLAGYALTRDDEDDEE